MCHQLRGSESSADRLRPHLTDTSSKAITTKSKPSAFPSALRSKRSAVQTLTEEDMQTDAVIRHTCPRCEREEMRYYTLQLRGADEGSTVFYTCECGYKFVLPFPACDRISESHFLTSLILQIQHEQLSHDSGCLILLRSTSVIVSQPR